MFGCIFNGVLQESARSYLLVKYSENKYKTHGRRFIGLGICGTITLSQPKGAITMN